MRQILKKRAIYSAAAAALLLLRYDDLTALG